MIYITFISCNPLVYDPTIAPMIAVPPMPLPSPMLFTPQFDPYHSIQTSPQQYFLPPQFNPSSFDNHRRSNPGGQIRKNVKHSKRPKLDENDIEQKALGDLPISFVSVISHAARLTCWRIVDLY